MGFEGLAAFCRGSASWLHEPNISDLCTFSVCVL